LSDARALARYWVALSDRIRSAETRRGNSPAAIYGSGFYGAYIASTLQQPDLVRCFLDRSPYQQGKTLFDKPVVAPEQLPDDVRTLYVGLNPTVARAALASMEWPHQDQMELIYLEGPGP
jgi:FlaA1/EpsC-like NDP-sugar epimerase